MLDRIRYFETYHRKRAYTEVMVQEILQNCRQPRGRRRAVPAVGAPQPEPEVARAVATTESAASFLGDWFEPMRAILEEIGCFLVEDLKELDEDDVARLSSTLKKIPSKKFVKKIESLHKEA